MNDFHFLRPNFLYLVIPMLFLVFFLLLKYRRSTGPWHHVCSKDLLPYILSKNSKPLFLPLLLAALALSLLIIAISGPSWQQISQPLIKQKTGFVIALDLSPAMDAQDIKPSRLRRAIYKINDLLEMNKDGLVALIVFSGNPFVVTPLTDDIATIKNLFSALETKIMPASGHRADLAIEKAANLLKQAGINGGSVLLITSELSDQEMKASIAIAKENGIEVSVLGVGTENTAPIPQPEGGFVKNSQGALVMASLSKKNLHKLAHATHGAFAVITTDDHDLNQLLGTLVNRSSGMREETELKQNKWHDQGYLLVLLVLPLASLIFRRGILILILFFIPNFAQAISFADLWKTKDQQAQELFQQEQYEQAKDLFQNRDWQAICSYKLGDYEHAAQLFQNADTAEGYYNAGTAKAKSGDLEGALQAYEKALELQSDHQDTLYNKKIIEEFLKQNKQDNQKQNKNSKKNKNQQGNGQEDNSETQDQNQEKQQNEGQNSESGSQNQNEGQSQNQDKKADSQNSDKQEDCDKKEQQDYNLKQQNKEGGTDKRQQKPQSSQNDPASDKQTQADQQDKLNDQYRELIEKEMQKEDSKIGKGAQMKIKETDEKVDPQSHIDEKWLKRIHDDPSGLLRRKFQQQYQKDQKAK